MKKYRWAPQAVVAFLLIIGVIAIEARNKKGVIMTVDGEEITTEEFLYLFQKNNSQQAEAQTIEEYFPLFEGYRLKVAEAKSKGIDTTAAFQKEMNMYKRELLEPYVVDTVYINRLVDLAMEREKERVESSHIMIRRTYNEERDKRNLQLLDSLRQELLGGADFIEMAKLYSQDQFSSEKGGYLGFNPAGTFPYDFETAVYETPAGEISEVVVSHVGYHIVKPGSRKPASEFNTPEKSYEDVKSELLRKVSSPFDSRYHEIRSNIIKKLKAKHGHIDISGMNDEEAYEALIKAEEAAQYAGNSDYRNIVDEYVNGSLNYEVSVENIWNKAANDDEGLQAFYEKNIDRYKWDTPHAKGIMIMAVNDSIASDLKAKIEGKTAEEVLELVKKDYKKLAQAERFIVAKGTNPQIDYLMFEGEPVKSKLGSYGAYFVFDGKIIDNPEGLSDVRNEVINDYQQELDQEWVAELKKRHTVEVNNSELQRIGKKLKSGEKK